MVTIKDIVKESGYGLGTVSRALNNHPSIKPETRKIILDAARRLGYRPNLAARDLASKKDLASTVGVVVPHLISPFYTQIMRGIYQSLRNKNARLVLYVIFEEAEKEQELTRILEERRESQLILVSCILDEEQRKLIQDNGINVTLLDVTDEHLSYVAIDNLAGAKLGTNYLLDKGYKNILYLGDAYRTRTARDREAGFMEAMQEANISEEAFHIMSSNIIENELKACFGQIMQLSPLPDAIFFYSDLMAFSALPFFKEQGLAAGQDIALLGYDDLPSSRFLGLSTVAQPLIELGQRSVDILFSQGEGKNEEWLKPSLVERETT